MKRPKIINYSQFIIQAAKRAFGAVYAPKPSEFDINKLPDYYYGVRKGNSINSESFYFSDVKGNYLEIHKIGKNDLRFVHDNFPGNRRFFSTNIPYQNIEQFEADLVRMNIPIPKRKI